MKVQELPPQTRANTVGIIGAVISILALIVVIGSLICVFSLDSNYHRNEAYQPGDPSVVVDKVENVVTGLGQIILFFAGGLVGGTLSLVGIIISAVGMAHQRRGVAWAGVLSGLVALGLLALFLLMKQT